MATHSSILAQRIPMDRGAWQATVHGVAKSWTERVSTSAILNYSKSHVEATIIEQMVVVVAILLLIAIFFSINVKILPVLILSHLYIIIAKTYYSTYHVTAKSLTVCHINQGGVSS